MKQNRLETEEIGITSVLTLVLWVTCVAAGIPGLRAQIVRLEAVQESQLQPVTIDADVTHQIVPTMSEPAAQVTADAMPRDVPLSMPTTPQLPAIPAMDSPPSFAEPLKVPPPRVTSPAQVNSNPAPSPAPAVQQLTLGEGAGALILPEYPPEAREDNEQGTVVVVFSANANGMVTDATAAQPCRWPILNQEALRAVRAAVNLPAGRYQVAVQFQLVQ